MPSFDPQSYGALEGEGVTRISVYATTPVALTPAPAPRRGWRRARTAIGALTVTVAVVALARTAPSSPFARPTASLSAATRNHHKAGKVATSTTEDGTDFLESHPVFFTSDGNLYASYTDTVYIDDEASESDFTSVVKGDDYGAVIDVATSSDSCYAVATTNEGVVVRVSGSLEVKKLYSEHKNSLGGIDMLSDEIYWADPELDAVGLVKRDAAVLGREEELVEWGRSYEREKGLRRAAETHHRILEEVAVGLQAAKHAVVLFKHWSGVQPAPDKLLPDQLRLLCRGELLVALVKLGAEGRRRTVLTAVFAIGELLHRLDGPLLTPERFSSSCFVLICDKAILGCGGGHDAVVARRELLHRVRAIE